MVERVLKEILSNNLRLSIKNLMSCISNPHSREKQSQCSTVTHHITSHSILVQFNINKLWYHSLRSMYPWPHFQRRGIHFMKGLK